MSASYLVRCFVVVCIWPALALSLAADAPKAEKATGIEGAWQGSLKVGGVQLRLVVKLKKKADDSYTATLDSVDQGAKDIPIDKVSVKGNAVHLELDKIKASYDGKLNGDRSEINGTWKQGGTSLDLILKRTDKPTTLVRPQEPKRPFPYRDEEVHYDNPIAKVRFAGTLTLPRGDGPFPAVVLITGSGPQDRDETVAGHKPFLVLADYLTRKGIAVLRVDDRGVGGSTGENNEATTEDFAGDALAGVQFLKGRKEINHAKIGLLGHSEGGVVAGIAAARSKDVAFVVMLAGTGLPGEEILYLQGSAILKAEGATEERLTHQRALQQKLFTIVKNEKDPAIARKKLQEVLQEEASQATKDDPKLKDLAKAQVDAQIKTVLTPWFRFFLSYDPRPTLAKVSCPVLALIGEKDVQVPPRQNLPEIEKALKAGGNKDATVKEMPGLNHLFQNSKTGAISEYTKIEETLAPVVLELVADWIGKHTTAK